MPKTSTERLVDHKAWDIFKAARDGLTSIEAAVKLGCTPHMATRAAHAMGLELARRPPPHQKRTPKSRERPSAQHRSFWPKLIELRENGKSYQEIGNAFGISRERVRQILLTAGRKDLTGAGHLAREKPVYTCASCGASYTTRGFSSFCSKECGAKARKQGLYKRDLPRALRIVKRREAGKTWATVAAHEGFSGGATAKANGCMCQSWLKKFCDRYNRPDLKKKAYGHGS